MTDTTPSPFQIQIESPEPWQRVIRVQVARSAYEEQYQRLLTTAVKQHERPGFRRGKTPRGIVEREVGPRLKMEAFESLVPRAYQMAVIEHQLQPISEPDLQNLVFEDGQDISFDLKVEVRPEVTARDYEGLPIEERPVEVTAAEVDQMLERLRESQAFHEPVDRPAQAGDQVVLDLCPRGEDGELLEDRRLTGQALEVGAEQNLPEFNEELAGAAAGEERELAVTYPEDYPSEELRGKTITFALRIDSVQHKVVPEADDAFAARIQEGQTLLELRGKIRQRLEQEAAKRVQQDLDDQVLDRLLERNEVSVPPSMLETWLQSGLRDLHQRNEQMGRPSTEEGDAEYREAARPVAERQIRGLFLLEAIRRQESLEITEEDIEAKIDALAAEHGFDPEKYREFAGQGEERDRIRHELEQRKTYDFLLSRAEISAADPGDDQADDPAADGGEQAAEDQG